MNEPVQDSAPATPTTTPTEASAAVGGALRWLPLIFLCVGILFVRRMAADMDHALANILTAGMLLLAWIALIFALLFSKLRGLAGIVLSAPFVAGAVAAATLRFERLDSELVPQFSPRWRTLADLPQESGLDAVGDSVFRPTPNDFPQFLGPTRDARLPTQVNPAWDQQPPQIAWKQPIGEAWSGFAIQGDAAITMEQRNDQEWVSAYSVRDGSLLWQYAIQATHTTVPGGTGPRSTPAIDNQRVYACSAVSQVVCLDLETGTRIWSQDLLALAGIGQAEQETLVTWGRAGSPLVVDDQVFVLFGGPQASAQPLISFDAATGEERWRGGTGQISYSSPCLATLDGVVQILLVSEDKLASYAPSTGEELWNAPWPGKASSNPAVAQPIPVGSNRLLLGKGYGAGAQLLNVEHREDGWKVETVWQDSKVLKTKFTTAVVVGDYAYGLSDGILECIEVATGERQWKRGRYRHGQLLLLGDHLLISSEAGELVLVAARPDEFEELANVPVISDVSWNTLAVSGNRVLMRNSEQAACVLLPLISPATATAASDADAPSSVHEVTE